MAPKRRKTVSKASSQANGTLHQTTIHVPTPEIEVSLVDRMRKRFSTRNTTSSGTDEETETSPDRSTKRKTRNKASQKKSSLGEKVMRIDKIFSPEKSSSRVFRSPTRFPTRSAVAGAETASESEERGMDVATRETELSDGGQVEDGSQLPVDNSVKEMSTSKQDTGTKRKGSTSLPSISKTKKKRVNSDINPSRHTRETSEGLEERTSDTRGRGTFSLSSSSSGAETKKQGPQKKGHAVTASGEINAHMADKEFISSQIRVVSAPFVMESGSRSWMEVWKSQQSSNLKDISQSVIDRIVTQINFSMDEVYQRYLSRQQQRDTLMNLDELRKETGNQSQDGLHVEVQDQASLEEIVPCYPSEWPGDVEKDDEPLKQRYASLRAKLFALSSSLSATKKQHEQYKCLAAALKGIDSNFKKYPSEELKEEIKRTLNLVSQIKKKLQTEKPRDESTTYHKDDKFKKTSSQTPLPNHSALVKMLFKAVPMGSSKPP